MISVQLNPVNLKAKFISLFWIQGNNNDKNEEYHLGVYKNNRYGSY